MALLAHIKEALGYLEGEELRTLQQLTKNNEHIDNSALEAMWSSLENYLQPEERNGPEWVQWFIKSVITARDLPHYHYLLAKERQDLADRIKKICAELGSLCAVHQLDFNIAFNRDNLLNGIFVYEDIAELSQSHIDDRGKKVAFSKIAQTFATRSLELIDSVDKGNLGKNGEIRRFVRKMARSNEMNFNQTLNKIIGILVLAIYGIDYCESDISNLLNR